MTYVDSMNTAFPRKSAAQPVEKTFNGKEFRLLDKLLNPLWLISYFSGILPTNFQQCRKQSRLKMFLSYTGVVLTFIFLNSAAGFTVFQLFVALKAGDPNIHDIIPLVSWFLPAFLAIFSQLYFVTRQQQVFKFLMEWRTLEKWLQIKPCITGNVHTKFYLLYSFLTVASLAFIGYQAYKNPDNAFFISSYKEVMQALTLGPLVVYQVYVTFLIWISVSLSECCPGFVFLSISLGVKSLTREIKNLNFYKQVPESDAHYHTTLAPETSNNLSLLLKSKMFNSTTEPRFISTKRIEEMWLKFKRISDITEKANHLFGAPMFVNHGVIVFLICSLVYSILYHLPSAFTQDQSSTLVTSYSANVLVIGIRFVIVTWVATRLSTSVSDLRASMSFFIGENWSRLQKEEREYFALLLDAVTHSNLSASPCGVYSITPSFFLTVLGIVLSYVIVLLQSK